jgi:glycerol-3-phosphate dehydrogenase
VSDYLVTDVRREDVDAAWSGIRPLALSPSSSGKTTQAVSRDHVIEVNPKSNLVTIAGGKWTTYRRMAEDVIDRVIKGMISSLSDPIS